MLRKTKVIKSKVKVAPIANGYIAVMYVDGLGYMGWGDTKKEAVRDLSKIIRNLE